MTVLKIKDEKGNWVDIPTIKGADGKDYVLTEEDKAEIVSAVIAELPVYNGEVVEE